MKAILLCAALATLAIAQENVSRVIQLKHIDASTTHPVLDIMSNSKVRWQTQDRLRLIVLNGPPELVAAMEAAIHKLDVPPPAARNVEATFHILAAGGAAPGAPVPAELNSVVEQLFKVFGMKSFRLLETSVIRGREGRNLTTSGVLPVPVKVEANPRYQIHTPRIAISPTEKGNTLRIDNLQFRIQIPSAKIGGAGLDWSGVEIQTDVDIREGQRVVVGKTSLDTSGQAYFLVVSAKVLE